jgi:Integrase core domain
VEVITPHGLLCLYVLFFIHIGTRQVQIAGVTANPTEGWMLRVAKEVTMEDYGLLSVHGCTRLIIDRDDKFSKAFRGFMRSSGVVPLRLPRRSPNLNAFAERWVLSVKSECLSQMVFFSEASLRKALAEYVAHYHEERNHQGLGNNLLIPQPAIAPEQPDDRPLPVSGDIATGEIVCRERLGGLLRYYYRKSA